MSRGYRTVSVSLQGGVNAKIAGADVSGRPRVDRVVEEMATQGWQPIGIAASGDFVHVLFSKPQR